MRLSVVVPIGVIVAVAIICVVVAVLSSAQRADEVALDDRAAAVHARAGQSRRTRAARDRRASPTSEAAYRRIRVDFDRDWVQIYVGLRLQSYFDHDFVFVADAVRPVHLCLARQSQRRSELVQLDPAGPQARSRSSCADAPRSDGRRRSISPPRAHSGTAPRRALADLPRPPGHGRRGRGHRRRGRLVADAAAKVADRDERQVHRRRRAGGDRVAPAVAQPAQGRRTQPSPAGDYVFRV